MSRKAGNDQEFLGIDSASLYIPSCVSCLYCCLCKSWNVNALTRPREQSESILKNTRISAGILYGVSMCLVWNEQCSREKNFLLL